jgi:glycosyltransferase involved in cell wall biosynthesis
MPERLWIVSELYHPEDTSTGYFLTRIAEGLARHMSVRVLCGQPSYGARGMRAPARETRHGVQIWRAPATTFDKDRLLLKLVNSTTISVSLLTHALWQLRRGDRVLVVTNPPVLPFLIRAACFLRGSAFLLLVHDVYPEVLVATGLVRRNGLPARLLGWLTKLLYRSAMRIVVLGRDMEALVTDKLGGDQDTVTIIPHWGDVDEIGPAGRSQNALLRGRGLEHKFVVQYSGNMGRAHALEPVLEAARRLRDRNDIHFLFVGTGAKKNWLKGAVANDQLPNVDILPYLPRIELDVSLNACDVAVIPFIPGMSGVSVPSRMYNVMAAGRPILAVADESSELARVVREEGIGWVLPPGAPDNLADTILEARANPRRLAEMGARARAAAEERYTLDRVTAAYRTLVENVGRGSAVGRDS